MISISNKGRHRPKDFASYRNAMQARRRRCSARKSIANAKISTGMQLIARAGCGGRCPSRCWVTFQPSKDIAACW
jgi:hypothetical protein